MIHIALPKSHWHGLGKITNLVVFGDSSTRYRDETTWLGHFLKTVNDKRESTDRIIQTDNYALPGMTVEHDISAEIALFFRQYPERSDLEPESTLYGINDCGRSHPKELAELVDKLFDDGLDEVFVKAGGRNFLLFDVPPKDRSPAARELEDPHFAERYTAWNELLKQRAEVFAKDTPQASVFLFSPYKILCEILDNPEEFGFSEGDVEDVGSIWLDELHFTGEVHRILAEELQKALETVKTVKQLPV